ncbi:C1 family peptidase [Paucibacter sp. PLA-PC-4]|uniref:C1 family peptidase n=1 Tax=Paucibacter sp. PLA-PC-4 TaxID=2993655 RepID=UPI0022491489|nr:C1 family peptidase [Paucibacter sp. PLA-PC-4]MCX2861472.1 C1 family peptidase [Paucibacter sp. PLA-PC-4]
MATKKKAPAATKRTLDARRDTLDFRDRMYVSTLVEVPSRIALEDYQALEVPILDQGQEGACTGFGLATVANFLLRRRKVVPDPTPVSPRMLYDMARRYDEWPGESYSGSSARGAMKGWHKHGVCAESVWPYKPKRGGEKGLSQSRVENAQGRPLGAYFRVNHKDLVAMHAALAEVGVLFATASVHAGWDAVGADGIIKPSDQELGGHAFAIVAYDEQGFWLQNSWGPDWGRQGFARIFYDDWLRNATDVWVARLGAPIRLATPAGEPAAQLSGPSGATKVSHMALRPHVVSVGNEGRLRPGGEYGMNEDELAQLFANDVRQTLAPWPKKRLLLYAHGGLVSEQAALQRLAEYRPALLEAGVYPLAFIWRSDYWSTISNILQDAVRRRRPEGAFDAAKDFLLDRLDDLLEPVARNLTGKAAWDEMKENALAASRKGGAAQKVAEHLLALLKDEPGLEIHLVAHSAGAILLAPLVGLLSAKTKIVSCTLWAPACTTALFKSDYLPAIKSGRIQDFALYALDDKTEKDDNCAKLYNKSLLYLVSNAFEARQRVPMVQDGTPILGLQRCIEADAELSRLFASAKAELVLSPDKAGANPRSRAQHHGDFDDDPATVQSTFGRILRSGGKSTDKLAAIEFGRSASTLRDLRLRLEDKAR